MSHADYAVAWSAFEDRRARKPHTCDACSETIEPGHVYRRWVAVDDRELGVLLQCGRCSQIFKALHAEDPRALIDWRLGCAESWLKTFGRECPPQVQALAFATQGELLP